MSFDIISHQIRLLDYSYIDWLINALSFSPKIYWVSTMWWTLLQIRPIKVNKILPCPWDYSNSDGRQKHTETKESQNHTRNILEVLNIKWFWCTEGKELIILGKLWKIYSGSDFRVGFATYCSPKYWWGHFIPDMGKRTSQERKRKMKIEKKNWKASFQLPNPGGLGLSLSATLGMNTWAHLFFSLEIHLFFLLNTWGSPMISDNPKRSRMFSQNNEDEGLMSVSQWVSEIRRLGGQNAEKELTYVTPCLTGGRPEI